MSVCLSMILGHLSNFLKSRLLPAFSESSQANTGPLFSHSWLVCLFLILFKKTMSTSCL